MKQTFYLPASFSRPIGSQTPAMPSTGWMVAPAPYWPTLAKLRVFVRPLLEGVELALHGARGLTPTQRRYHQLRVAAKL